MNDQATFLLRIPRQLLAAIRELAATERRTVSGQIVQLLSEALKARADRP